ncbi:MAG: EamA family transporter [Desulfococcaceae bacterium]
MQWLLLSLLTALAVSSQDACVKKFFSGLTPVEMSVYPLLYSLPLFAVSALLIPVPHIGPDFLWCFLISIPLNGLTFVLYMKALKISPLSLTVPYLAFTPVFMILTGYLFLDEIPGIRGMSGIGLICAGGYVLQIDPGKWNLLAPVQALFREKGSRIMLFVAFVYSLTSVIGKKAILNSSPLFFTMTFYTLFNVLMILFFRVNGNIRLAAFRKDAAKGLTAGLMLFFHGLFHGWAISLVQAAYMISVKRLSVVISVLYGRFLFKEENMFFRLSGAVFMLAGTILIMLPGN